MLSSVIWLVYGLFLAFFPVHYVAAGPASHFRRSSNPVRTIYEFPHGTWVENLAVRAEGSLLVTTLNAPSLYLLDPSVPHAQPVAVCAIPPVTVLLGITETAPDEFALVGGKFSVATGTLAPHSFAIWRVRLHGARYPDFAFGRAEASVSKIADLPDAVLLNGITQASSELALVSDSFRGVI
jgi:hypothetical protein